MPIIRSLAVVATTFSVLASHASALVLKELPHTEGPRFTKRGDPMGCLDLRSQESFYWGAADPNQAALGNLTVYMPADEENIVSMERFNGMLTSVTCSDTTLDIAFSDDNTFAYAKQVWDWVNGADNHTFVMVAAPGTCGVEHRQPYTISTLDYDEAANVAHLGAVAQNWTEAIHTYDLNVGTVPHEELQKRSFGEIDYNKDLSLDFNHPFPVSSVSLPMPDGVTATLDMSNCNTAGSFAFTFTLETILLIPKKAEMSVQPQGVAVTIEPVLDLSANISQPSTAQLTLDRINLAGIQIPAGILDIGPEVVISVGATIGPLEGEAKIGAGVVYSLDDSAIASIDIMGASADQSGWTPNVQTQPLTVDAELSGTVKAFVNVDLALVAKAFSTGFDLGVNIQPYIEADLQTVAANSGSACGSSNGLNIDPSYGADLILNAHTPGHDTDNPLFSITLASISEPLPDICLPFSGSILTSAVTSPTPSTSVSVISSSVVSATSSPVVISSAVASSWIQSSWASSSSSVSSSSSSISSISAGYAPYWPVASSSSVAAHVVTSSSAVYAAGYAPYQPAAVSSSPSSSSVVNPVATSSTSAAAGGYGQYQPYAPASDPTTTSAAVYAPSTFSTIVMSSSTSSVAAPAGYAGYGYGSGYGYHGY